jgi:acyl carrier protein
MHERVEQQEVLMNVTRESLTAYLSNRFGLDPESLEPETPLFSSGLLDSFSMLDVISHLEKETGTKVRHSEVTLGNLDTVGRILRFLAGRPA